MADTMVEVSAVPKRTPKKFKWWDGNNTAKLAQWLVEQGVTGVQLSLGRNSTRLSVGGYGREIPAGELGVWVDEHGSTHSKAAFAEKWEVVHVDKTA